MSVERNVGRAVLDLGEIVKTNTITAVARANGDRESGFSLSDEELAQLVIVIGAQIDSTVRNSVESITRLTKQ
jgi:hypothetical protein